MYYVLLATLFALAPLSTNAAAATSGSLQGVLVGLINFLDQVVIPVILAIAFLAVVWNTVRFFIIGADNEESQQNAKTLAFYSVAAFVFFLGFWGMVNILINSIGLSNGSRTPCQADKTSDYVLLNNGTALEPCTDGVAGSGLDTDTIDTTILPDVGSVEAAARDAQKSSIQTAAYTSYTNDFTARYGANKDVVASALFPDLIAAQSSATDLDRLRGAYRLSTAGTINSTLLDNYLAAAQAYNTKIGHPELNSSLTLNNISNIVVPLPASVTANINASKNALALAISNYNATVDMGTAIPSSVLTQLYDTSRTTEERLSSFTLYRSNLTSDGILTDAMATTFIQNINTENAFRGTF